MNSNIVHHECLNFNLPFLIQPLPYFLNFDVYHFLLCWEIKNFNYLVLFLLYQRNIILFYKTLHYEPLIYYPTLSSAKDDIMKTLDFYPSLDSIDSFWL